jgi:large subunit ribosomal protein L11
VIRAMPEETEVITLKIKGGKASPQDLSKAVELGYDGEKLAEEINRKTSLLKDKEVEVRLHLYLPTKDYYIEVVPPETTELLLWKAGAKAPSGDPAHNKIGDISIDDVIEIAIIKKSELLTRDLRKAVKMILGSARSIGLTVEGKDPKEISKLVDEGGFEEAIKKYEEEWLKA